MKKETSVNAQIVLRSIEKQAKPMFKSLQRIDKIDSVELLDQAGAMVKALKESVKIAEQKEKSITTPLMEALSNTRELFKPFKVLVKEEEERIKNLIIEYHEKNEKQALKLEEDFRKGKIKNASTYVDKQGKLTVSSANSSLRKGWEAECVAPEETPRKYLVPDVKAIEADLRAGKKVKGWILKQTKSVAI